jgi:uncharacterized protein YegP (UPF0339 family)
MRLRYTLEIYRDKKGEWRWRFAASNGRTLADSGEGYATRGNAIRAARRLQKIAAIADVVK